MTSLKTFFSFLAIISLCVYTHATVPPPGKDGKYTIRSKGIVASFIPYSAAVSNLWVPDRNGTMRDVVLGYDNASAYPADILHPNYGAIPGRYANRIVNATYVLDGKRYYTMRNDGNSTMHSGTNGWSYRTWNVTDVRSDSITFSMRDTSNSSMGMLGLVVGNVTYSLGPSTWSIHMEAEALTHSTPLMLTNHAYWNLNAFASPYNDTVLNHTLSMPYSKRLIAYDEPAAMPNGTILDIPHYSINDFWSSPKHVGANDTAPGWIGNCGPGFGGYDCGWIMNRDLKQMNEPIVALWADWTGIKWEMYSNQAGLAMTSCGFFPPNTEPVKSTQGGGVNNGYVPPNGCIAVEPSDWMSGINFPEWGREKEQIWYPGKGKYINDIEYRFSIC